jgi:hypothetical protein
MLSDSLMWWVVNVGNKIVVQQQSIGGEQCTHTALAAKQSKAGLEQQRSSLHVSPLHEAQQSQQDWGSNTNVGV